MLEAQVHDFGKSMPMKHRYSVIDQSLTTNGTHKNEDDKPQEI